jgi:hypothetical protein
MAVPRRQLAIEVRRACRLAEARVFLAVPCQVDWNGQLFS